ncbi:hypothetical protein BKA62DRAFT_716165 [Auriculariales sp. MPI-PUGE-AT-0066]|nr:hypothetical protein BKA62DRAFT_716165 [Auriculariales sp. MPI-PUGE-AT-0066]
MVVFMEMPPELVSLIIEAVVLREDLPPTDIKAASANRQDKEVFESFFDSKVITQTGHIVSNSTALLQTSRGICSATDQVIQRLRERPGGLALKLDILVVGERELWTTWVHVPVLQRRIDRIDARIRIADGHTFPRPNGLNSAVTGPPAIVYCMYFVLAAFLRRGPAFDAPNSTAMSPNTDLKTFVSDRHVSVGSINIDVNALDPISIAPEDKADAWRAARWRVRNTQGRLVTPNESERELYNLCMRPEWFSQLMTRNFGFSGMLQMYEADYGAILHERVGEITVSVEGKLDTKYDIGQMFASLVSPPNEDGNWRPKSDFFGWHPHHERPARFAEWWSSTLQKRLELGFSVGDASLEQLSKLPGIDLSLFPLLADDSGASETADREHALSNTTSAVTDGKFRPRFAQLLQRIKPKPRGS